MSRLDELFDAAQEIEPARRRAWLDVVCGGDDDLRCELQRLLRADAHAGGILESGRPLICGVLAEEAEAPNAFGVWRVLGSLGAGGMGAVWLAERDDAGFVQRAAIKQVAWPTPGLLQRFRNERQILARLEHPGIARLIDGGVDAGGCPYLAMEYVEGTRIDTWVREHKLDVRAIVRLLLQVCDAMQFAHRNLVVHSDIKPSNILVGDDGKPRLLDFGIAKVLSEDGAAETRTMTLLLTPDYAAPEWLAGGAPNTAVDIYALGVLAYELLSGGKPYRTRRDGVTTTPQLPDTPTRPPSSAVLVDTPDRRARLHALRGDLDRVVMTAMAREPERRYATVEAFASDLRNWLDGRAVAARGDHAWYRLRKFVARNRVAVGAAALAVCALVLATAFSLHQARVARQQAQRAEAVRRFLDNTFAQMEPVSNNGKGVGMHVLLERSEQRLEKAVDVPLAVRADLTTMIGKLYWNLADNTSAERALKAAVALAQDGGVPDEVHAHALLALAIVENDRNEADRAYRHAAQAHQLALRGRGSDPAFIEAIQRKLVALSIVHDGAERAEPALRELLASDRARYGDSQATVDDLIMLGHALDVMARYDESETTLLQATATARRLNGKYRSSLGLALDFLGITRMHRGAYVDAEQAFIASGRVTGGLWGEDNVRTSITREQALEAAVQQGRLARSLPAVLAVRDEAAGMRKARPDHYASSWQLLGDTRLGLGQFAQAEAAYRQALALWGAVPQGGQSAGMAATWSALAAVFKLQGRWDEAEQAIQHAIDIDHRAISPAVPWLARDLAIFASVLRHRGRPADALVQVRAALVALPSGRGGESPITTMVRAELSQALLAGAQSKQALSQAEAALAVAARVLPHDNWQLAPSLFALGCAQFEIGNPGASERTLKQALALLDPIQPPGDPRVLEIEVALIRALDGQGKTAEVAALRAKVEPLLAKSDSPYLANLRRRLDAD